MDAATYYVRPEFKVHFYRITGEWSTAVNRPGSHNINPQNNVEASLDLMKDVGCEYSPPNVCDRSANGSTMPMLVYGDHQANYITTNYGGAAYVCTKRFDLQRFG